MQSLRANETPRVDLLERDVLIQFNEIRRLREEKAVLEKQNARYEKIVGRLKAQLDMFQTDEQETFEDVAFYINSQRKSLGLSYNQFARMFDCSSSTIENYEKCKGSFKNAMKLADKIREYRRNEKSMASANQN